MSTKKKVLFFISYSHADLDAANLFLNGFKEMSAPSMKYEYIFWQDTTILPGEKWSQEIQAAINKCDIGLLLLSPAFLGSQFISEYELPCFIGDQSKPMIPVMIKKVNFQRHNLKGLKENQIFRFQSNRKNNFKSYAQCGSRQKDEFVYEFFDKVEAILDKLQQQPDESNN